MELASSNKSAGSTSANNRPNCPIDSDRLWDSIMAMAEFGGLPGGGCARLSLSDEDRAARDQFVRWCRDARCEVCLSTIKSGHIGGAARRELGGKESAQPVRRRARTAHPSPRRDACACHFNISCMTAAGDGGGTRRARQRGQGIPVGSNRSAFQHMRFATGNAAMLVGRGCLSIAVCG